MSDLTTEPTILEILTEISKDLLGKGSTFEYGGYKWIYDGKNIRTKNKNYFYGEDYPTNKYLSEVATLENLNDRVENFKRKYTAATMAVDSLFKTRDVHYYIASIYRCPVCGGKGIVPNGFYRSAGEYWFSSTTAPEQCRSCCGKGYIKLND